MEYSKFKVSVRCFTFNQKTYITDALNGFTMQKTDFPFVCTIVDDASTDGEQQVIMDYLDEHFDRDDSSVAYHKETDYAHVYYAQHKQNKNCYFAVLFLKKNHYSQKKSKLPYLKEWNESAEYMALCEGDDYWIDENKLQKQVLLLDSHQDYSMIFHNALVHYEDGCFDDRLFASLESRVYSAKEIINNWLTPTASMVFRMKYADYMEDLHIDKSKIIYGDNVLTLSMLHYGCVYGLGETLSVYRKHIGGAVFSISEIMHEKFYEQLKYCQQIFPEYALLLRTALSETCFYRALKALKRLNIKKTCVCTYQSIYYSKSCFYHSLGQLIRKTLSLHV